MVADAGNSPSIHLGCCYPSGTSKVYVSQQTGPLLRAAWGPAVCICGMLRKLADQLFTGDYLLGGWAKARVADLRASTASSWRPTLTPQSAWHSPKSAVGVDSLQLCEAARGSRFPLPVLSIQIPPSPQKSPRVPSVPTTCIRVRWPRSTADSR